MIEWPSIVTAVATSVGALAVGAGGLFAWRQLKGLRQQTGLSALAHIFEQFNSECLRKDRLNIYQNISDNIGPAQIIQDEELHKSAQNVMFSLNQIGFLVRKGLIPMDRALAEFIGPPTIRMWDKLECLIKYERKRRAEEAYMTFFEELAHLSQKKLPNYKQCILRRT